MLYLYIGIIIFILLIMLFTSRTRIKQKYNKYTKIQNSQGLTGAQVAQYIINNENLDISLAKDKEDLCDAYYPTIKTLLMSEKVCDTPSLASVAIVCHELGHATQHRDKSALWNINTFLQKFTRVTNKLILPFLIFGLLSYAIRWPNEYIGMYFVIAAGVLFIAHALLKLLIIPLEFNASKRAIHLIEKYHLLTAKELRKSRALLKTAGQTYIVALFDDISIFTKKLLHKLFR